MLFSVLITAIIIFAGISLYFLYIRPKLDPMYRAETFEKLNLLKDAIIEYKKALDNNSKNFEAHYSLAGIYLRRNEIDQAIHHLEKVLELNRFNYRVDKLDVQKKLAHAYYLVDDLERAFTLYLEILTMYPSDPDALYHVSFMALGQEEFEFAQKYFERLAKINKSDFEVFFGAGICSYQNQKISDAIAYFRVALDMRAQSDAANLAMAFVLQQKKDFKQAVPYINAVLNRVTDPEVLFVAKRLLAFLYIQMKRFDDAVRLFEELLVRAKSDDIRQKMALLLYDAGYACISAGMNEKAYAYWNELYQIDKTYKDIQNQIAYLRRELDAEQKKTRDDFEISIADNVDDWVKAAFPDDFLWNICGLKSDKTFELKNIVVSARIPVAGADDYESVLGSGGDLLDRFSELDTENFRIIANRVVQKMGYKVDQILQTYRESDGVDFLAVSLVSREKTLVWVRRWSKTMVGEITLRNFAQAINDSKAKQGIFITATDLTDAAKGNLNRLSKVTVIYPDQLNEFLRGLL